MIERFTTPLKLRPLILFLGLVFVIFLASIIFYSAPTIIRRQDKETILMNHKVAKAIFHDLTNDEVEKVENLAREQLRLIVSKPQFSPSLEVVEKHEKLISEQAQTLNIPPEVALGMALLENGGSETAISYAGAAGIFQLTEGTAKTLGLSTAENNDERLDPEKNIKAGLTYLSNNLRLFSDIGLAVWSYHACQQNVSVALKTYLKSIGEKDAFDYLEAEREGKLDRAKYVWKAYVTKDGLNVHKLIDNPLVKLQVLSTLGDETELYPYKVLASTIIYQTHSQYQDKEIFAKKVALFNQGRIFASDLLDPTKPPED